MYNNHISTILTQLRDLFKGMLKTASFWSLLFAVLLVGLSAFSISLSHGAGAYERSVVWSSGGPVARPELERSAAQGGTVYPGSDSASLNDGPALLADNSAVSGASDPLTNLISLGDGLKRYKIKKGDTFTNLATRFNISADTIRWANPGVTYLKPGDTLVILPVSGVLYNVSSGEAMEDIGSRYQTDISLIKTYNPNYQKILSDGGYLVLPFAKPISARVSALPADASLPDLKNYFSLPAIGWNWGQLHNYNAVDIANQCGTPVQAAAEGLAVSDENFGDGSSGWNDGYGIFVLLEHPNGTKTRYAHLDKALVKVGDYITRGEEIGLMGNTGNTHGPTGCHVHFEVYGAKNPFAVSK